MISRYALIPALLAILTLTACNGPSRSGKSGSRTQKQQGTRVEWGVDEVEQRAKQGQAYYQHHLAMLYRRGRGVTPSKKRAFEWEMKAANQKYIPSYYWIGLAYLHGDGIQLNETDAFEWLTKASEAGFPPAIRQVGKMYINGQGVRADKREGIRKLRAAAAAGDKEADRILMEEHGIRVPR